MAYNVAEMPQLSHICFLPMIQFCLDKLTDALVRLIVMFLSGMVMHPGSNLLFAIHHISCLRPVFAWLFLIPFVVWLSHSGFIVLWYTSCCTATVFHSSINLSGLSFIILPFTCLIFWLNGKDLSRS